LSTQVTGLTIIALGTSLPDTIASRTAALHDDYADASIGNITGSNRYLLTWILDVKRYRNNAIILIFEIVIPANAIFI